MLMDHAEYTKIKALNWSNLKLMETSPLFYDYRQRHPREDSPSLLVGRAAHCAVLEPERFAERYVVPELRGCAATTKKGDPCSHSALPFAEHCGVHGGQGEADVYRLGHPGVEVLTADQGETVRRCAAAVRAHPEASALIDACDVEQVVTWQLDGLACKGRLDLVARDGSFAADLKTCRELRRFARDAAELCYHGQGSFYTDGGRAAGRLGPMSRYYLIAVESAEPYDVGVFEVAGAELTAGRELYRSLLDTWVSCRESGVWYGRYPVLTRLELPRWAPGMAAGEDL
jgi:exodeoxyribonuclease VIII